MKEWFIVAIGAAGGAIAAALGGWDASIQALLVCMGIDFASGVLLALIFHKSSKTESGAYSSDIGAKGLARKFMVVALVVVGNMLDRVLGTHCIRDAVCIGFIANEGLSIVENVVQMGIPVPEAFTRALDVLSKKSSGTAESGTSEIEYE